MRGSRARGPIPTSGSAILPLAGLFCAPGPAVAAPGPEATAAPFPVSLSSPRIIQTSGRKRPRRWFFPERLQEDFGAYLTGVAEGCVLLQNLKDPAVLGKVFPRYSCRYLAAGQPNLRRRVRLRLRGFNTRQAVLLCLTYDPKRLSVEEAWASLGGHLNAFLSALRAYLPRHGDRTAMRYFWVVEEQPKTGYPHVHLVFSDRAWLAPKEALTRMWGHGWTEVEKAYSSINGISYALKYLGKLKKWSSRALALSWAFGRRWYGSCRYAFPLPPRPPSWTLFGMVWGGCLWFCGGDGHKHLVGEGSWAFWEEVLLAQGFAFRGVGDTP